ncbi:MAG: M56 family metallopeptidase [Gemmatimonadaceae bacterium]
MPVSTLLLLVPQSLAVLERLLPWLATYAIHSTVLILSALVITSRYVPWRLSAAVRDAIWKCALVGGLVTASVQPYAAVVPVGGSWPLGRQRPVALQEVQVRITSDSLVSSRRTITQTVNLPAANIGPRDNAFFAAVPSDVVLRAALILFWLSVVAVVVLRYDRALSRLARLLSARRYAGHTSTGAILRHLAARAGVTRPVVLTVSDVLCSPAAIDGNEICVPTRFLTDVNVLEQESILAHELAHLVRRDVLWLRIVNLVTAVFFFQPLNRLARISWQRNAEFAADDWAVRLTGAPLQLARGLATVAAWIGPTTPRLALPAIVANDRSVLVQRVGRLTAREHPPTRNPGRAWGSVAVVAAMGATVAIAPRVEMSSTHSPSAVQRVAIEERVSKDGLPGGPRQVRVVQLTGSLVHRSGHDTLAFPAVAHERWMTDTTALGTVIVVRRKPAIPVSN